ncbi:hypothetical protein SODALDRAFT_340409 [Sodiomyces alkalinus F11]|uniref:DUF590-domain-containing protein n=1 Tax=Sodiomyces alkalinus (strain CBS 110278 / VKM F-3762 / F11) TaxID=1314773 RepID=A0A3N2PUK5_SODAK|nr:hypothetical protein SODALDRAFT_340409 [Sodiomyces alkalinus F11]ROT38198.1 hypothetical protein SODALDRAFT_340409 [Sodiomyces alkalinus F11]
MDSLLKIPPSTPIIRPSIQTPGPYQETCNDKYVVKYNFADLDPEEATEELKTLLTDLEEAGLQTEVRAGYDETLLIFVKAPRELLGNTVYKSRVKDWLYGVVHDHPGGTKNTVVDAHYESEDILSVYHLVHWSKEHGGAGIHPGIGQWKNVEAIFPLHNQRANQKLLSHLSKRFFLTAEDLDKIRDIWGSKIAFYFAFLQTYLVFLIFPAVTGVVAWLALPKYSLVYAITTCVWCTVFVEYWKLREVDLSIRWRVRNVAQVKTNRPQFTWERVVTDCAGRKHYFFPKWKQVVRQLLQFPFFGIATAALGLLIVSVFAIEVLISESYEGPYKFYLEYLPTVLLAVALPYITSSLEGVASALTQYENHRTEDNHERALAQKVFVLNIVTNYLPILLTAFVYVPFGDDVVPWLEVLIGKVLGKVLGQQQFAKRPFQADGDRLRNEVIALVVTGQISGFFEENVVPFVRHRFSGWWREMRRLRHSRDGRGADLMSLFDDDPDEAAFLTRVRDQSMLRDYDVQEDIAEIVLQSGYLALFSPVWPLIPLGFLVNNWIELRSDFLKISIEHKRPHPVRTDGIGPWVYSLNMLSWLGSISTAAIVHMFSTSGWGPARWASLPITIFVGEHVFLLFRTLLCFLLNQLGSPQIREERSRLYATRLQRLEELEANKRNGLGLTAAERERRRSMRATGGDKLFTRQVEEGVSAAVGVDLIRRFKEAAESKKKK